MARIILRVSAARKQEEVALSNGTVRRSIDDLSTVLTFAINWSRTSRLLHEKSLQLGESTDVLNFSQLVSFVRYVKEKNVEKEFSFCDQPLTTTTAKDVFKLVKVFFTCTIYSNKVGPLCTGGAAAMLGNRSGSGAMLKEETPDLKVTRCLLHRQSLVFITLTPHLMDPNSCGKIFIYSKDCALNHHLFQSFCQDVNQNNSYIFFYRTDVRWLSRSQALNRFLQLWKKI